MVKKPLNSVDKAPLKHVLSPINLEYPNKTTGSFLEVDLLRLFALLGYSREGGVASCKEVSVLCDMYFKVTFRNHPELGPFCPNYRLVESYRNIEDRICHKTILDVGFVPELKTKQLNVIQKNLTQLVSGRSDLFLEENSILDPYVARFCNQILANKTIDVVAKSKAIKVKLGSF